MAHPGSSFTCETVHVDGEVLIVLAGDMDLSTVDVFRDATSSLTYRYDACQVKIDCAELTFIDAHAIGHLVRLVRALGKTGRPVVWNASPWLQGLLRCCGVDALFDVQVRPDASREDTAARRRLDRGKLVGG